MQDDFHALQPVRERAEVREKTETTDRAEPRERSEAAQSASDKADQMRSSTRLKRPDSGKVDAMAELRARRAQAQERQSTKESARLDCLTAAITVTLLLIVCNEGGGYQPRLPFTANPLFMPFVHCTLGVIDRVNVQAPWSVC